MLRHDLPHVFAGISHDPTEKRKLFHSNGQPFHQSFYKMITKPAFDLVSNSVETDAGDFDGDDNDLNEIHQTPNIHLLYHAHEGLIAMQATNIENPNRNLFNIPFIGDTIPQLYKTVTDLFSSDEHIVAKAPVICQYNPDTTQQVHIQLAANKISAPENHQFLRDASLLLSTCHDTMAYIHALANTITNTTQDIADKLDIPLRIPDEHTRIGLAKKHKRSIDIYARDTPHLRTPTAVKSSIDLLKAQVAAMNTDDHSTFSAIKSVLAISKLKTQGQHTYELGEPKLRRLSDIADAIATGLTTAKIVSFKELKQVRTRLQHDEQATIPLSY
jgi:hypothetical protein